MFVKESNKGKHRVALLISGLCLSVPLLVFAQNYDDHNRHGKRLAADFGRNYLESCEQDGIIFCNGDNDTFPLWYAQEVEGVRRDLRVCNTSYLQADWYIEQMKKDAYDAKALPISWGMKEYGSEKRSIVYIIPLLKDTISLSTALKYASSDDPAHKVIPNVSQRVDHIPTDKLALKYDHKELIKKGELYPHDTIYVENDQLVFDLSSKKFLGKQELIILNMLENGKFERPMYYCLTVPDSERVGLAPNFRQTGMAYKVMPFAVKGTPGSIDVERMYQNVTQKFRWGGADVPNVYMDENARRSCETYRSMVFAPLATALLAQKDTVRAREVLALCGEAIRDDVVPHSYSSVPLISALYKAGEVQKASEISEQMIRSGLSSLRWYFRLSSDHFFSVLRDIEENVVVINELLRLENENTTDKRLAEKYGKEYHEYEYRYMSIRKRLGE